MARAQRRAVPPGRSAAPGVDEKAGYRQSPEVAGALPEKALHELGHELNNRPEWTFLPLAGIRQLLETSR